jgi:hypothetical protein
MRRVVWTTTLLVLLAACGNGLGDPPDATDATETGSTEAGTDTTKAEAVEEEEEGELPDVCSLITEEEASALAGHDLVVGGDSFLGCGFAPPDSDVADLTVNAVFNEGDAATVTAAGFPNADEIIPVGVGEDTVAVTTPAGDAVASIVTASDGKVVELALVFLLIDPEDMTRIEEAAELAVTALGRWESG